MTDLFVFAGFLYSGKSTLINSLNPDEKTLIISLEEGEEKLKNGKFFKNLTEAKEYIKSIDLSKYEKVFLEYNGTLPLGNIYSFSKDIDLILRKTIYVLDGKTADNYLLNMTTLILEQINYADIIYIRNKKEFTSQRAKEVIKTLKSNMKVVESIEEIKEIFENKKSKLPIIILIIIFIIIIYKLIKFGDL